MMGRYLKFLSWQKLDIYNIYRLHVLALLRGTGLSAALPRDLARPHPAGHPRQVLGQLGDHNVNTVTMLVS